MTDSFKSLEEFKLEIKAERETFRGRLRIMYYRINRWIRNAMRFPMNFKWWYQRARRGYSDRDAWNADKFLAGQIAGMLKLIVQNSHGVSMAYASKDDPYGTDVEKMAAKRDREYAKYAAIFTEYSKNGPAWNKEWRKDFGGVLDKDMEKALKWLSKHFQELWD